MIDDLLRERVRDVVNKYDPIRLLRMGAPTDEYDLEIQQILPLLSTVGSASEFHDKVHDIFVRMFTDKVAGPKDHYSQLSEELYSLRSS